MGGVVSLLWFRRRLPEYATKFIEMVRVPPCVSATSVPRAVP